MTVDELIARLQEYSNQNKHNGQRQVRLRRGSITCPVQNVHLAENDPFCPDKDVVLAWDWDSKQYKYKAS